MLLKKTEPNRSIWFAAGGVIVVMLAMIVWSLHHPYGIHWDEAKYLDEVGIDLQRLLSGNLLKLGGRILFKSWGVPPAYRLLALPFVGLFGFHTIVARMVSLACFGVSAWLIYLTTRRIAGPQAGAFALLVFALSPDVVGASIFFSTEAPLYVATSAMLYFLMECWSEVPKRRGNWIGLGLAIGLGFLSKASFAVLALPVLAFWFVLSLSRRLGIPSLWSQWGAGAIAIFVAAPWWLFNFKYALAYSQYARGFVRDSLGSPSVTTSFYWLSTVILGLIGPAVSLLILLILISTFRKIVIKKEAILDSFQKAAVGACACTGVPIALVQLSGTNHLLRHISPAVIPLAIAMGVLADRTGWVFSRTAAIFSFALFFCQLIMLVTPVVFPNDHPIYLGLLNGALPWRTMARVDQWDWKPARDIADNCGLAAPTISYLGGSRAFNPPQIQYPWVARAVSTRSATYDLPEVTWLWRFEEGSVDWQKVMDLSAHSDLVITAPHYVAEGKNKEDIDNQYNAEFADRLSKDSRFRGPVQLQMGRFESIQVDVFLKNNLACKSAQPPSSDQESQR